MFYRRTKKRYAVANDYTEHFLLCFIRTKKVLATLEDLECLYYKTRIGSSVKKAKAYMLHSTEENQSEEKALLFIEREYPDEFLCLVHRVCLRAQSQRKDISEFLGVLLKVCEVRKKKGYRRKKALVGDEREVEQGFFQWFAMVSLYLQWDELSVAVFKSYDDAEDFLKPEVKEFLENLRKNPESIDSYRRFLKGSPNPAISYAMLLLYSASGGEKKHFNTQLAYLLEQEF